MPGGGTRTFLEPDHYEGGLGQAQIEFVITCGAGFRARQIWAELHQSQLLRLRRASSCDLVPSPAGKSTWRNSRDYAYCETAPIIRAGSVVDATSKVGCGAIAPEAMARPERPALGDGVDAPDGIRVPR
jgi:hypothetical protein